MGNERKVELLKSYFSLALIQQESSESLQPLVAKGAATVPYRFLCIKILYSCGLIIWRHGFHISYKDVQEESASCRKRTSLSFLMVWNFVTC